MTDESIVQLYLDRDETAITMTQDTYGRYLYCIAFQILANEPDSEESVNDTYMAAWNSIPPHIPVKLSAYLGKLIRRISIDRYRYRHRDKRCESEYAASLSEWESTLCAADSTEQETDGIILSECITQFVKGLSVSDRQLFLGRYYYFDPLKSVAAYCGMSESRAKTRLFRLRAQLKSFLQKEGFCP